MREAYSVQTIETRVPVAEYLRTCVDVEKFLGFCRECSNYGRRWSCPPFEFDPLELWNRYDTLHLYARVLVPAPGADTDGLLGGMKAEKEGLLGQLLALERAGDGALLLSAGSCTLCGARCTRPDGAPCRCPEKMRYSIEALGGNVAETAERYLHKPLLWIEDGRMPDYLTLVCGLLTREEDE